MTLTFPTQEEVLSVHKRLIEEFGGSHGLRDEGALESAIAAAGNRAFYEGASLAVCAATYAFHLTQAHAFIDGNKRVAAAVAEGFVRYNRAHLAAGGQEIIALFLAIAAGEMKRDEVEEWFEQRVVQEEEDSVE